MTDQFYFSLLNPAIAFTFSAAFLLLWHRVSTEKHLLLVSAAFACTALAFIVQDFPIFADETTTKLVSNACFVICVALACASGLERVGRTVPWTAMGLVGGAGFVAFGWFLFVAPSTLARAAILGVTMATFALMTLVPLLRMRPLPLAGQLIALAAGLGFVLAILRPLLAISGVLNVADAESFQQTTYWVTVQAFSPLLIGTVGLLFLAAMSIETVEQLRAEANHDHLTGLLNRRGFEAAASAALNRDGEAHAALLMADIDDFKRINDSFGHKVGDQVIAGVAKALAAHGGALFAARVGGEEFALYYRCSDRAQLQRHAEIIRQAVGSAQIAGLPVAHPLTLSIGLHSRAACEGLSEMLIEADRALYKAKKSGKDRAVLSPPALRSVDKTARLA